MFAEVDLYIDLPIPKTQRLTLTWSLWRHLMNMAIQKTLLFLQPDHNNLHFMKLQALKIWYPSNHLSIIAFHGPKL